MQRFGEDVGEQNVDARRATDRIIRLRQKGSYAAFDKTVACAVVVRGQDSLWVVVYALHALRAE